MQRTFVPNVDQAESEIPSSGNAFSNDGADTTINRENGGIV